MKLDRSAISILPTGEPFNEIVPERFPRSLCEIAANNVVLPEPLLEIPLLKVIFLNKNKHIPRSNDRHQLPSSNRP